MRLHDLRHSFASVAASGGQSLVIIGKMLGHSQPATTARYAHLADDPVKAASDAVEGTSRRLWRVAQAARLPICRSHDAARVALLYNAKAPMAIFTSAARLAPEMLGFCTRLPRDPRWRGTEGRDAQLT